MFVLEAEDKLEHFRGREGKRLRLCSAESSRRIFSKATFERKVKFLQDKESSRELECVATPPSPAHPMITAVVLET